MNASGKVLCWGHNRFGELGSGDNTDRLTPAGVVGLADIVQVSAGHHPATTRPSPLEELMVVTTFPTRLAHASR